MRSAAAIVIDWSAIDDDGARLRRAVRRRVESLTGAGVHVALIGAGSLSALRDSVRASTPAPGRLLLCTTAPVHLVDQRPGTNRSRARGTEKGFVDPLAAILAALACDGIGPGFVLMIGSSKGPLGAAAATPDMSFVPTSCAVSALDHQLRNRSRRRVPCIAEDPAWVIRMGPGEDPVRQRINESLLTIGAGGLATRGAV